MPLVTPEAQIARLQRQIDETIDALPLDLDLDAERAWHRANGPDVCADRPAAHVVACIVEAERLLAQLQDAHARGRLRAYDPDEL